MKNKIIYLLIGQKGSGKSHIGSLMDRELGIPFIRVEDWAREVKRHRAVDNEEYLQQVFEVIEQGIRDRLPAAGQLVFESTGLTVYFDRMLQRLQQDFKVVTIGVQVAGATCLQRVKTRDGSMHINVSDEQVLMINDKVRERGLATDFVIHNETTTDRELVDALEGILANTLAR